MRSKKATDSRYYRKLECVSVSTVYLFSLPDNAGTELVIECGLIFDRPSSREYFAPRRSCEQDPAAPVKTRMSFGGCKIRAVWNSTFELNSFFRPITIRLVGASHTTSYKETAEDQPARSNSLGIKYKIATIGNASHSIPLVSRYSAVTLR